MLVAIAALVACTLDTGVSTSSLTAASGGVAAFAVAMSALGAGRRTPPPEAPMFGCAAVGTTNPCKLAAVRAALATYPEAVLPDDASGASPLAVCAYSVPSGVSEQPMTLEETARGARNRADAAYRAHAQAAVGGPSRGGLPHLGVGIESGLFVIDGRHFDVCVVSAYDGAAHHLGLSCAFEIPKAIMEHVLRGCDLSQACNASLITSDPKLGEHGGLIGLLSSGRITREQYTVQALNTALFFAAEAARPWYA